MNRNQARMLLLISARRAATDGNVERLDYAAETAFKFVQVERLRRALRGRLVQLGATRNTVLSLLNIAGRAGETFDFEALAYVAETVVQRKQIQQLQYDVQCRLAHLASMYGTPTREASAPPLRALSSGRSRKPARRAR